MHNTNILHFTFKLLQIFASLYFYSPQTAKNTNRTLATDAPTVSVRLTELRTHQRLVLYFPPVSYLFPLLSVRLWTTFIKLQDMPTFAQVEIPSAYADTYLCCLDECALTRAFALILYVIMLRLHSNNISSRNESLSQKWLSDVRSTTSTLSLHQLTLATRVLEFSFSFVKERMCVLSFSPQRFMIKYCCYACVLTYL